MLLVGLIAYFFLPYSDDNIHYQAPRFLGKNTRLASALLSLPAKISLEDRFRLIREYTRLEGKYVKHDIEAGRPITPDDVSVWPDINPEEAVPFELESQPDWMFLNTGTTIEIWLGDKRQTQALILAIVPSGNKWLALLQKKDLQQDSFDPSQNRTVRIVRLPGKAVTEATSQTGTDSTTGAAGSASPKKLASPEGTQSRESNSSQDREAKKESP